MISALQGQLIEPLGTNLIMKFNYCHITQVIKNERDQLIPNGLKKQIY
jgi:hypothetical protein